MKKLGIILLAIIVALIIGYFIVNYFIMRNVTEPSYQLIKKEGNIEIRLYEPMITASVIAQGKREQAISKGFRILADYIFGDNHVGSGHSEKITGAPIAPILQQKGEQKIAMTAPVMQKALTKNHWQISFVMPAKYSLENLPKPNDPNIEIVKQPSSKRLVVIFSGRATAAAIKKHLEQLQRYIEIHQLVVSGQPIFAFYNPPWTLPFMRRNEIHYRLSK